ncbi:transposase [Sphingobium sufflavum]|uniref:exonuclease domain-containing protein n=1 Tax=Sphingobium sufflavum TaxID=1129547 RepID=UPI001F29410A|nr:exonuclease domain-containing protein [Sphingobium sufflavum]MCE7797263.1 transposase [Sphingobium sufflavum]
MTSSPPVADASDAKRPDHDEPDFVVVDVETACARVSSICQIGIVGFRDGLEVFAYETLVDPRDEFSAFNIGIHGITVDHVIGQPTYDDIGDVVSQHLGGRITVAHSAFDKGALAAACRTVDRATIEARWLDSVRVAKQAWPDLPSHRLNVLARFLGLKHRHHDALSDARAAGMVILKAIEHTGIDLAGWMATAGQSAVPPAAASGPLKGERVAILGEARDGRLAHVIAGAGGQVVSSVGLKTTMLIVATRQPYGRWVSTSAPYRKAEAMIVAGKPLLILTEESLRATLFLHPTSVRP